MAMRFLYGMTAHDHVEQRNAERRWRLADELDVAIDRIDYVVAGLPPGPRASYLWGIVQQLQAERDELRA